MPNRHWRCGEINSTTGKPCRNIVSAKGEYCYRHLILDNPEPEYIDDVVTRVLPSVSLEEKADTHILGKQIVDFLQQYGVFEGKNGQLAYAVTGESYVPPRWYQTIERLIREGVIEGSGSKTFNYSGGGTRYYWRIKPELQRPVIENEAVERHQLETEVKEGIASWLREREELVGRIEAIDRRLLAIRHLILEFGKEK